MEEEEEAEAAVVDVGRSHWLHSGPKTTPHKMIDSSGLFVPHGPFSPLSPSMAPLAAHEGLSQVPVSVCVGERESVCVCVRACLKGGAGWWRWGCILEIKPPSPMVDCPAIETHSVALKGSLRHQ